ncbi:MAG: glutamine synthetase family protein [Pseudomonadaceae bacterium]|nr:glutamine synthetase family protein [Pseudomonadaceae bacterium]
MSKADQEVLDQKLAQYREKGVSKVKLGLTDIDGVIRGKYVNIDKFASLLQKQGGFCDCVFGWDVDDQLYEASRYTGWHTGFPDTGFRLLVETERWLPDEAVPYFVAEFVLPDGSSHPICPRTTLQRVLDRYARLGLTVRSGFEYEFFVFEETPHSVREKGYQNLKSLTPGNFGYSVLRTSVESELFSGLMDYALALDCDLEGLHCETGPGVWEGALKSKLGIEAADRANLFKTFTKVYLQKSGLMGTFMAKWSMDYPGQSGHFHFSVQDEQGNNPFYDDEDESGMSALQGHAVAGLEKYLPELLALIAPTINSYTRLVKGAWAPTAATWGVENRTSAVRVIPGGAKAQRIECRVGGADGNPYLVASAVLAAALQGIEEKLEPGKPVEGNAYDLQDSLPAAKQFPGNLRTAAQNLAASTIAVEHFGEAFVEHFVMSRLWECDQYDRNINSWQLGRYFEII